MSVQSAPYVCPRCGKASYHPEDKRQRYCGQCHRFEDALESVALGMERIPIKGGWRYLTTERCHFDILGMLYSCRLAEIPLDDDSGYGRFWCFPNLGSALEALIAWDWCADTEPVGWIKSWDERYSNPHIGMKGVDGQVAD